MPKVDLDAIEQVNRTGYPPPFDEEVRGRWYRRLAPASGLTDFGVSHVTLKPGAWSSQRHWHDGEDEFLVMLSGEAVLVEDDGGPCCAPGDCAAWPKGSTNGHHLVQRERERLRVHRRRRRHEHRRRLFRHRHDVHAGGQLRPQGRHALRGSDAARLGGLADLVLLDHPRLVLRLVDPLGDMRVRQHRLHIGAGEAGTGTP